MPGNVRELVQFRYHFNMQDSCKGAENMICCDLVTTLDL